MPCELLLPIHLEVPLAVIYHNLVVHGLTREVFHVWMHRCCGDGVHVGFADVLRHNRDSELPNVDLLVVSCGDKSPPVFNERDGVDGAKVFLVLLNDFLRVCIKLENFLV